MPASADRADRAPVRPRCVGCGNPTIGANPNRRRQLPARRSARGICPAMPGAGLTWGGLPDPESRRMLRRAAWEHGSSRTTRSTSRVLLASNQAIETASQAQSGNPIGLEKDLAEGLAAHELIGGHIYSSLIHHERLIAGSRLSSSRSELIVREAGERSVGVVEQDPCRKSRGPSLRPRRELRRPDDPKAAEAPVRRRVAVG